MFNHFEPLAQTHPELVQQLERVVAKTGVSIPPSRMFLMKASEKYTSSNAYVTGFGSSQRVVVWDNTIKNSPPDEILMVFGHELGHYVLHHIERGLAMGAVLSLFFLWIGSHFVRWLIKRYGPRWHIASLEDWAATGALLLVLAILSFAAEPIANGISRAQEHQADVFGLRWCMASLPTRRKWTQSRFSGWGNNRSIPLPIALRCLLDLYPPADRRARGICGKLRSVEAGRPSAILQQVG